MVVVWVIVVVVVAAVMVSGAWVLEVWIAVVVGTGTFKHEQAIDNWAAGYSFAQFGVRIGALRSSRSLSRFSAAATGGFPGLKIVLVLCGSIS